MMTVLPVRTRDTKRKHQSKCQKQDGRADIMITAAISNTATTKNTFSDKEQTTGTEALATIIAASTTVMTATIAMLTTLTDKHNQVTGIKTIMILMRIQA